MVSVEAAGQCGWAGGSSALGLAIARAARSGLQGPREPRHFSELLSMGVLLGLSSLSGKIRVRELEPALHRCSPGGTLTTSTS